LPGNPTAEKQDDDPDADDDEEKEFVIYRSFASM
jgi:hypothetical protein